MLLGYFVMYDSNILYDSNASEISASKFAKQLLKRTTDKIFSDKKTPILHVDEHNAHAIQLYEQLGFVTRRKMGFCMLEAV